MIAELPVWLEDSLSLEEVGRIEAAVKAAEKRTSAEIVPMIVHRSTLKATGDRILFWICFGLFGITGAMGLSLIGGLDELILDRILTAVGLWPSTELHTVLAIFVEIAVGGVAFLAAWLLSTWLSGFDAAHRFVFPVSDQTLESEHRAELEFFASDLRSTKSRSGVLLFVSMLEHRAVILADQAVIDKVDPKLWTETLTRLLGAIRNGQMGQGYVDAVGTMAKVLEVHFPLQAEDRNELEDRLRILE